MKRLLQRLIDWLRGKVEPDPVPEPVPEPEPSEPVNKGGDGLYKPESRLWLLPLGIRAPQVMEAGEEFVNYFRVGGHTEPFANGHNTFADDPGFYHNNRLKLRGALASGDGVRFFVLGWDGKVLAEMVVQERNVRQEGRTRL